MESEFVVSRVFYKADGSRASEIILEFLKPGEYRVSISESGELVIRPLQRAIGGLWADQGR